MFLTRKSQLVAPEQALPGRTERPWALADKHLVLGTPLVTDEAPEATRWPCSAWLLLGRRGDLLAGPGRLVDVGRVRRRNDPQPDLRGGLHGRHEPHRGGADRVRPEPGVLRRPGEDVLRGPRPDPGFRQGNDVGTQYRSAIYFTTLEQERTARELTQVYGDELKRRRLGDITTEIRPASETPYFYAEDAHQQYLAKNPFGYRCHANTGVKFPATA